MIKKVHAILIIISGLYLFVLSGIVITGYVFDLPVLINWNEFTKMALATALCFNNIGLNMVLIGWQFYLNGK